ncbi:MAG: tRNA (guanosine(46)-N7)-methyltransferase TrmB [Candidatus Polarisedimenticolaceae bacterium]|nr:tRNA (guanosine(46)-N7)-methyltransferase TrmB [Candidatus Polarisedimenticolaceae bacterium]
MTEQPLKHRPIRSFVLREGRMTEGQQRAFEEHWSRFGIDLPDGHLDLPALFDNDHPVIVEIGFGNGESLFQMAQNRPEYNYLGIEVHRPGVGHLMLRLAEGNLSNVRVMRHDAMEILRHHLADHSLAGLQLFFPDPWHKKRHNKRRIVRPEFIDLLRQTLQPGGFLHMATDWEHYAEQMMKELSAAEGFKNSVGDNNFTPRPDERPLTKFEQRGERLGHGVWDLIFIRQ